MFGYENERVFPIYISNQKFEDSMALLLLIDDDKSHYVYIKYFNRFMFPKTKNKNQKKDCLSINGTQSVKLEKGIIEFENFLKQITVSFKIYADFEFNLKKIESYEGSYIKNIKITFLLVLLTKLLVFMLSLLSQLLFLEVKMQLINLLKQFLKCIGTAKK